MTQKPKLQPGQAVLGREELARAWRAWGLPGTTFVTGDTFDSFATSLGLGKDKA